PRVRGRYQDRGFAESHSADGICRGGRYDSPRARIPAGRLVLRPGRRRRRLRAATPRAYIRDVLLEVLARLQEWDLRTARRGGDGVLEPLRPRWARQLRRAAGHDRLELRRYERRDAARGGHALLERAEHQHYAVELRGGTGLSQGGAAVWRPLVLHELAHPATFKPLCRAV